MRRRRDLHAVRRPRQVVRVEPRQDRRRHEDVDRVRPLVTDHDRAGALAPWMRRLPGRDLPAHVEPADELRLDSFVATDNGPITLPPRMWRVPGMDNPPVHWRG